ncbi:hypothetical protein JIX56_10375 [Streptomyces sp. CA-210063]|uniref:hypothetical protein n=1 Tax=Streptomyces sp. CA-210063 TaxID=2801029 RepID=UPI00214BEA39|nr:hypothetical protein [Streptomyces sp. CA-210063]UUU30269.1 hypothetical protein JIX56_10375 [Streptomyces sp. CA-210063]
MVGEEDFGPLLQRLLDRRGLDPTALSRLAASPPAPALPESELRAALAGAPPSPSLLRRLAPALGLHTADLFAIAGVGIPDDLAPLDATAGSRVPYLVRDAVALPPDQRNALRRLVASLPQKQRTQPVPETPRHQQYPPGPGALLMRMIRTRNLGWTATAHTFLVLTGRYWSAATYGGVGRGRKPLTPDLVADFAALLDVPAADLEALTGVSPPTTSTSPTPAVPGVAELIWDVRRLTASQLRHVGDTAEAMREQLPDGGPV